MKSVPPSLHVDSERERPGARPAAVIGKHQTPSRLQGLEEEIEKLSAQLAKAKKAFD